MKEHKIKFGTLVLKDGKLVETNVRFIKQSDIGCCPFFIMVPEHYREDGSCKCDDPLHRRNVMYKWGYTKKDFIRKGVLSK